MISYLMDGRIRLELDEEDVELAEMFILEAPYNFLRKLDLAKQFHQAGLRWEVCVGVLNCAEERIALRR